MSPFSIHIWIHAESICMNPFWIHVWISVWIHAWTRAWIHVWIPRVLAGRIRPARTLQFLRDEFVPRGPWGSRSTNEYGAHRTSVTLSSNANLNEKHKFDYVFLKVTSRLIDSLQHPVAWGLLCWQPARIQVGGQGGVLFTTTRTLQWGSLLGNKPQS